NSATSAITRYAPAKRYAVRDVCSFSASCTMRASVDMVALRPGFDNHCAPHGVVGHAAIFMTQEGVGAGPIETGCDAGDLTGKQHGVDVGSTQQEPMDDILTGRHEGDVRALWDPDLRRIEEPDAGHQMGLIPARGDLDHTRLIEGRRLHHRGRIDPSGLSW